MKKIKIHEDSHSTEEDISNSDIEEWQAVCPICESPSQDFLLICEGEYGCSNVCHTYCLNIDPIPDHWVCQDCENQESESLVDENSSEEEESSEIGSEMDSDPDAEYEPVVENFEPRRSLRRKSKKSARIRYESSEEAEEESFKDLSSDEEVFYLSSDDEGRVNKEKNTPKTLKRLRRNSNYALRHCNRAALDQEINLDEIPKKRTRNKEGGAFSKFLNEFVKTETEREMQQFYGENFDSARIQKKLVEIIGKNQRLSNYKDPRTVQKMKAVIKNFIVGLI